MAKREGGEWRFLGSIKTGPRTSFIALPCDNGKFIAVSNRSLRIGGMDSNAPFYRMSAANGKDARIGSPIEAGHGLISAQAGGPA